MVHGMDEERTINLVLVTLCDATTTFDSPDMAHHKKETRQTSPRAQSFGLPETHIPEDEQWRLVNDSGILDKATSIPRQQPVIDEHDVTSLGEEIFGAILLIVPFCFLLLMMEMFVSSSFPDRQLRFSGRAV